MQRFLTLTMLFVCAWAPTVLADDPELAALIKKLDSGSQSEKIDAARSLGDFGPASASAVPSLIAATKIGNPGLVHEVTEALGKIQSDPAKTVPALTALLADRSAIIRAAAIDALRMFGPAAKSSLEQLHKSLGDTEPLIKVSAARAIAYIDWGNANSTTKIVPVLIAGLKSPQDAVASEAIQGLAMVGPAAAPALQELLNADGSRTSMLACDALSAMGPGAKTAVDKLLATAKSSKSAMRWHALNAIGSIGPDAKSAVPALVEALSDQDHHIRYVAEQSLLQIGKPAVADLVTALKSEPTKSTATRVLTEIGPDAAAAVPALTSLLQEKNPELRREVILALASIGPDAKSAAPELVKILQDKEFMYRAAAAFAIGKLNATDSAAAVKTAFQNADSSELRLASLWTLLQFDPKNEENIKLALPLLKVALEHERPQVRREAARALSQLGVRSKDAVAALAKNLNDKDAEVRRESLIALAEIGSDSAPALEAITAVLNRNEPGLTAIACYALGRIGEPAKGAIPQLRALLFSRDFHERTTAAWALVTLSPDAKTVEQVIPTLADGLKHSVNPMARVEAANTLGKIGSGSAVAKAALNEALKDPEEAVRKAAQAAISQLK